MARVMHSSALRVVGLVVGAWVAALLLLASGVRADGAGVFAQLRNQAGEPVGKVKLLQDGDKVNVSAVVRGLAPGFHGFHVHAVGQCVAPFTSSGGHYDAAGQAHGGHAGDLPALLVNGDGTGQLKFQTDRLTVADLFDADGSAFVIHAGPDNYANVPARYHSHTEDAYGPDAPTRATGDAGARVACGVVG